MLTTSATSASASLQNWTLVCIDLSLIGRSIESLFCTQKPSCDYYTKSPLEKQEQATRSLPTQVSMTIHMCWFYFFTTSVQVKFVQLKLGFFSLDRIVVVTWYRSWEEFCDKKQSCFYFFTFSVQVKFVLVTITLNQRSSISEALVDCINEVERKCEYSIWSLFPLTERSVDTSEKFSSMAKVTKQSICNQARFHKCR